MSKFRRSVAAVAFSAFVVLFAAPAFPNDAAPDTSTCTVLESLVSILDASFILLQHVLSIPQG